MVHASKRAFSAPESPIRKLVPYADAAKRRGIEVFHLNIGQPDIETPEVMRKALANYGETVIAYSPSAGEAPFREFLLSYYSELDIDLDPEHLLVTTGGSEAVLFAFASCLDQGDEILVPDPMYANYMGYSAMLGNIVSPIPTSVDEGYHLPENIDDYITGRTKAILLCNPANPTGAVYSESEMQRIIDAVVRHDLFLIADEVYREFVYDGGTARSILTYPELAEHAVVVDSLSKRFSLCGARIGCLVSRNKDVMAGAMKYAQARLSPPGLAQVVAAAAKHLPADYFEAVKSEYRCRRDVVFQALNEMPGVTAHRPEGAFYQMARLPVADAESFVRFMLDDFDVDGQTMMVAPGGGFYAAPGAGNDEVRIAYVLNETDLKKSMAIMKAGLEAYNDR